MSVTDKMIQHQDEIAAQSQRVQDAIARSSTGEALLNSSQQMATSEEMVGLMQIIDTDGISEDDKFLMGKYMGQLLQEDPANGLVHYADYLNEIAADPTYADRSTYFRNIAQAALLLQDAATFRDYVEKYSAFEADQSPEAASARQAMEEMSNKMRELIEGDSTS